MLGSPTDFWGKLDMDAEGVVQSWHPLLAHLADVAACVQVLIEETTLGDRLASLAGTAALDDVTVARLTALAALHDLGKLNQGFQAKASVGAHRVAGHVKEAVAALCDANVASRLAPALGFIAEDMGSWGSAIDRLLLASIGHHGRPVSPDSAGRADPSLWRSTTDRDPIAGARAIAASLRRWVPAAFEAVGPPLPTSTAFQHAFAGLVTLADWLGSDTRFFAYADDATSDRFPHALTQARSAVRVVGLSGRPARDALGSVPPTYARFAPAGFVPRPAQETLAGVPLAPPGESSLVVLEAETGAGKTEAALGYYLRLLQSGRVDGMYFALPTRTAATQIQRRLVTALARAFPDEATRPPVVLAVPGYVKVDDVTAQTHRDAATGALLPRFEVLWPDDARERMRHRGWAAEHPKRALAGGVVVGTVDQALLSALAVRHAHLRASSLLRQLLVVDEVHASDAYMNRILRAVVAHQLDAGGHVLLMSATLGASALGTLLTGARAPAVPGLEAASRRPYPLVSTLTTERRWRDYPVRSGGYRKVTRTRLVPWLDDAKAIAAEALSYARGGACVLVMRNTVSGCVEVQEALEALASEGGERHLLFTCAGRPAPHHSRFARADRVALDQAIEAAFGGDADRSRPGVVAIATQTVQQSLDLDADVLLTDLCPMDVLLQRIGRLHRHAQRPRPAGYEMPTVIVLVPESRDLGRYLLREDRPRATHGIGIVYQDVRVLEATWRELEAYAELVTPDACRQLVERTTHEERLRALSVELGAAFGRHEVVVFGTHAAHGSLASLNTIPWDKDYFDTMVGELRKDVATRLGERDRLLVLPEPLVSPFGHQVATLQLPGWMVRSEAEEIAVDGMTTDASGETILQFGQQTFRYSRHGLAEVKDEPATDELEDGA